MREYFSPEQLERIGPSEWHPLLHEWLADDLQEWLEEQVERLNWEQELPFD